MSIKTNWLFPPRLIAGQDQLGSQAPCEMTYSQLLMDPWSVVLDFDDSKVTLWTSKSRLVGRSGGAASSAQP